MEKVIIAIVACVVIVVSTVVLCNKPKPNLNKKTIDSLYVENNKLMAQVEVAQGVIDSLEEENEYLVAKKIQPRLVYVQKIDSNIRHIPSDSLYGLWAELSRRYFDTCQNLPCTDTIYSSLNRMLVEKIGGR